MLEACKVPPPVVSIIRVQLCGDDSYAGEVTRVRSRRCNAGIDKCLQSMLDNLPDCTLGEDGVLARETC